MGGNYMKYQMDEKLIQAILNYLVARPYSEVHQLIRGIQIATREQDYSTELYSVEEVAE